MDTTTRQGELIHSWPERNARTRTNNILNEDSTSAFFFLTVTVDIEHGERLLQVGDLFLCEILRRRRLLVDLGWHGGCFWFEYIAGEIVPAAAESARL